MRFQRKVVVITGASMGIGEAIAKQFVAEGANVVVCSRDLQRAEEARTRIGSPDRTLAAVCDVTSLVSIKQCISAAVARYGRIDIWINNAGHGLLASVAMMSMAECRKMFDTNLFGALDCMQAVVPLMKQNGGGTIVNISSVAGHIAVPGMAAYSGTKFALNALSRSARLELKPYNIHVLTVCPGYIQTAFGERAAKGADAARLSAASKKRTTPERVARAVVNGCAARKREIVVPATDRLKIKLYQLFPRLIESAMARMLKPMK